MEKYITPREVQEILKLSKTKTYAIINQEDFPKIRVGKNIRIPVSEFEKFMKRYLYKTYEIV